MCEKFRRHAMRILSAMMLVMFITAFAVPTVSAASAETLSAKDFKVISSSSAESSAKGSSVSVTLTKKGAEIKYGMGTAIDLSSCSSVKISAKSIGGSVKFRFYDADGKVISESKAYKGKKTCTVTPSAKQTAVSFGIVSASSGKTTVTLSNIAFSGGKKTSAPAETLQIGTATDSAAKPKVTTSGSSAAKPAEAVAQAPEKVVKGQAVKPAIPSSQPTLLNTQGKIFGISGCAVNSWDLKNEKTLSQIVSQYNAITLENETKPDSILGWSADTISIADAKNLGYYIPSGYAEDSVPRLKLSTLDSVMKTCYDNNLKLRFHTLVWHSQTPDWFFREGYSKSGKYVSAAEMDKRMEFYIKTMFTHVYSSPYGEVVYAWDVCNEYLHANKSGWSAIYGSNLGTSPEFVRKAFTYAYDMLKKYNKTSSVELYYNDYNCYEQVNSVIKLVNYLNENGKVCAGVGMQMHLATKYPSVTMVEQAVTNFNKAGLKVQMTEMDITNSSEDEQAKYVDDLFTSLVSLQKSGKKVNGITWWGLSDKNSWRKSQTPLLFSELGVPKRAYDKVLEICK